VAPSGADGATRQSFSGRRTSRKAGAPPGSVTDAVATVRIHADSSEEALDLFDFLDSRIDAIVERVDEAEIEISLLGSYTQTAMRQEIGLRVRSWEAGRRGERSGGDVIPLDSSLRQRLPIAASSGQGQTASPNRRRRSGLR
jgi:hypothetical protein